MAKFFIDGDGKYLGGFEGAEPPVGAIEVPEPPAHASMLRVGNDWVASPVLAEQIKEDQRDTAAAKEGATLEEKVNALWERVVNGNANATDAIQAAIEKAKTDIP